MWKLRTSLPRSFHNLCYCKLGRLPHRSVLCRFAVGEGDLVTGLNAWHAWQESGRSGKWAHNHFLNHRTLLRAADIRAQLTHHLRWPADLT